MKDFHSNDEFFAALRALIDRLCDERRLAALARLLPELLNALKATRGLGHEAFTAADWDALNDVIHAANLVTKRRQNSN